MRKDAVGVAYVKQLHQKKEAGTSESKVFQKCWLLRQEKAALFFFLLA